MAFIEVDTRLPEKSTEPVRRMWIVVSLSEVNFSTFEVLDSILLDRNPDVKVDLFKRYHSAVFSAMFARGTNILQLIYLTVPYLAIQFSIHCLSRLYPTPTNNE